MTSEQFAHLLEALKGLSPEKYTLTGAADWPILASIGCILIAVIGFMWRDLRAVIKDNRSEWKDELDRHKKENEKSFDLIWEAHRDCQNDCCPRKKREEQ